MPAAVTDGGKARNDEAVVPTFDCPDTAPATASIIIAYLITRHFLLLGDKIRLVDRFVNDAGIGFHAV